MPSRTRSKARPSAGGEHVRLERRLVLLAWLNGRFPERDNDYDYLAHMTSPDAGW